MTEAELQALADEILHKLRGSERRGSEKRGSRQPGRPKLTVLRSRSAPSAPSSAAPSFAAPPSPRRVADFVDHTLLKAEATREEVIKLCAEAAEHRFAAVCVNPTWVPLCAERLHGTPVKVCTVIGFPLGATTIRAKAAEAREAVAAGAGEIDMVLAIGRAKSGEWGYVEDDIHAVVEASRPSIVKVIIESAALTQDEILKASALSKEAGAHFVKTSTGFHAAGGASVEAVRLMKLVVGDDLEVKASGGVRDCATALAMIGAGASRIGTSSGAGMVSCLGPGPLSIAELIRQPHAHAASCTSGKCASAGGTPY